MSIAQTITGHWQVTLKNNTTGQSYQEPIAYNSSLSSAEWVEEAPSARRGIVPLDAFGTISFSGGSTVKNGQTDSVAQAGGQPLTMIDATGQALATPSTLNADGSSFSITRNSAHASTPGTGVITIPLPIGTSFPGLPIGRGRGGFARAFAFGR